MVRAVELCFSRISLCSQSCESAGVSFERGEGQIGKGSVCMEYADQGTGDFRTPSYIVADNADGSTICPLKYRKHKVGVSTTQKHNLF